jgi:hypothetical protein
MSLAAQIETVQPDVYAKLLSEPFFNPVAIFKIREKRLDSEVNRALTGLAGRNGGSGATIEVLMPTLKAALAETAGPVCTLEQQFMVKEQPTVNLGAYGTGLTAEQIAVNLAQTFQLFFLGGALQGFYTAPLFYQYQAAGANMPFIMLRVTMHATFVLTALERTLAPAVAENSGTITLTDQQPGGGSKIYYTIDGSFPGAGNAGAVVYAGPFAAGSGTVVRTAAYNGSTQGSMVDTFTVA